MNTNQSCYFERSIKLMEKMLSNGICQYFYSEGNAEAADQAQAKNNQELFIKGLTLYFTLTGQTDEHKRKNYECFLKHVSDKVKEIMKNNYRQFKEWTNI